MNLQKSLPAFSVMPNYSWPNIRCPTDSASILRTGARCSNLLTDGEAGFACTNMPFKQAGFYYATSPPVVAGGCSGSSRVPFNEHLRTLTRRPGVIRGSYRTLNRRAGMELGFRVIRKHQNPMLKDETYSKASPNSCVRRPVPHGRTWAESIFPTGQPGTGSAGLVPFGK